MANGWGGSRPGSGRKKMTEEHRDFLEQIKEGAVEVIPILIGKAKNGETEAIKYLMNRAFGVPRQQIGIETKGIMIVDDKGYLQGEMRDDSECDSD